MIYILQGDRYIATAMSPIFPNLKITEAIPQFVAIALHQGRNVAMRACRQWLQDVV
ncbi:hypothetical protein [Pseudanabaena sp. Chao 1811]|uniref:hypothetical protein n=1 Tax=Pseudanabaena sp. Chao 1811 TaxID=2963092 RepID=UPI0022F3C1B8|nr:hypothetical protein [Pseudanabaena sp. Chao 1811]